MRAPEAIDVVAIWAITRGRNDCAMIRDGSGRALFFKRNTGSAYRALVTSAERRRREVAHIVASHLMAETFGLPIAPFRDVVLRLDRNRRVEGIACAYLTGLRPFHEAMHRPITNREDALLQIVVLAWLGDTDRIETPDNECVDEQGRYIALDFDFCFNDGVSILGLPKASRRGLEAFATPAAVARIVDRIAPLSDETIARMVDDVGRAWVHDWTPALARDFTAVLVRNRDALRQTQAFEIFQAAHGSVRQRWSLFATRHIFRLNIPVKLLALIQRQGPGATIWTLLRFLTGRPAVARPYLSRLAAEIDRIPTRAAGRRGVPSPRSDRH